MTKEEILAMEAGRELDALIEEKLFSHQVEWRYCNWLPEGWYEVQSYYDPNLPSSEQYSGGLLDEDELHPCYREAEKWVFVRFHSTNISAAWPVVERMNPFYLVHSELGWECNGIIFKTAPEAICKAALMARLAEIKKLEEGNVL